MQSTVKYKAGYIHSTYPDQRYPISSQGSPRFTAQVGQLTHECRTYIGAQRKVTSLMSVDQSWENK